MAQSCCDNYPVTRCFPSIVERDIGWNKRSRGGDGFYGDSELGLLLEFETRGLVNHWIPEKSHGSVKFSVPCELVNNECHALLAFSFHDGVCLRAIGKRGKYIAKSWNERISMDGNLNELLSTDSNFEGILVYGWLETASIKKEIERSDLLYVMKYNKK